MPSRRSLLVGMGFAAIAPARLARSWTRGAPPIQPGWEILPLGAGGFLTGISIANDGTMAVRTDTYGGWIWNPTATSPVGTSGAWQQVVNFNSMPAGYNSNNDLKFAGYGAVDLQVSYSSPSTMYLVYTYDNTTNQMVFKSTNKGQTWAATGYTPTLLEDINGNAAKVGSSTLAIKAWGNKLAIDPTNPNNVFIGTGQSGLFYTTNGGTSWNTVSTGSVPAATSVGGNFPAYTICIGVFSATQYVVAFSYGNGIYLTTGGGGGTWNKINTTGPTTGAQTWSWDPNTGYFYCIDLAGNAWQYTASAGTPAWTEIYSGGAALDITCDPTTANHIVIMNSNGQLAESTNGTSFGTFSTLGTLTTMGDVAWMSLFSGGGTQRVCFSPLTTPSKTVFAATNRSFQTTTWTGTLSSGVASNWINQARGIEQLVGNCVTVPTSGVPILGFWDSGLFYQPNLSAYPPASNSYPNSISVYMCSSIDYASSNLNYLFALVDGGGGIDSSNPDISAFSSNGGQSWTQFTPPAGSGRAGSIAASTPTNVIFAPNHDSSGNGQQPYFTTNFSASPTWTGCTLPSDQTSWTNFNTQTFFGGRYVCADRVNANTFYLAFPNAGTGCSFYKSTNSGATWTNIGTITPGFSITSGAYIKSIPGEVGFWFCGAGAVYQYNGTTLTQITNLSSSGAFCIGFGANSGGGYPSVFIAGYLSNGTYGIFRSDNASGNATPTWNQIGPWPFNSFDAVRDISGDPGIYEQCYVAFTGSGFAYYNPA